MIKWVNPTRLHGQIAVIPHDAPRQQRQYVISRLGHRPRVFSPQAESITNLSERQSSLTLR